jgi:hypothetical protein
MKYIFVAGAPGSKWSSVVKNIYYSPDVDQSDYSDARTYYHDASGKRELMHLGAYFDPGMEFNLPDNLFMLSKSALEDIFNSAFSGEGVRIVKSHIFALNIDFLRACWPDSPVVLVHRPDDACLGWWVKCGHFDITYPDYAEYYQDLRVMAQRIQQQNQGINDAVWNYKHKNLNTPANNYELCEVLGIAQPPGEYRQNYAASDITVKVIK